MSSTAEEVTRFERSVADPQARHRGYVPMVKEYYRLVGDVYREAWGASHHFAFYQPGQDRAAATAATEQDLADRAGITSGMHVLDVGSGVGGPALAIAAHTGARVTGLDLVPNRVAQAQQAATASGLADKVTFTVGDAMQLPFVCSTFGGAYSFEALCHVPDKERVHREVARVLQPGAAWTGYDWLRAEQPGRAATADIIEPICQNHGLVELSTLSELAQMLTAAGFTDVRVSDAQTHGDWEPNWEFMEHATQEKLPESLPPVRRMMVRGAQALCEGVRNGSFLIGHWYARVPECVSACT